MSYGFNDDKSKEAFTDAIKFVAIDVTTQMELPGVAGAEMGGALDLNSYVSDGYKPVGVVGWNLPQSTCLRSGVILPYPSQAYNPEASYVFQYVLTNLNTGTGKKTFRIILMMIKAV